MLLINIYDFSYNRLILIAEKEKVYKDYPIPLINRLEKHFVLTETILLEWQKDILTRLGEWITKFSVLHSYGWVYDHHHCYNNVIINSIIVSLRRMLLLEYRKTLRLL